MALLIILYSSSAILLLSALAWILWRSRDRPGEDESKGSRASLRFGLVLLAIFSLVTFTVYILEMVHF